jgi:HK97 family phage major capsid protein
LKDLESEISALDAEIEGAEKIEARKKSIAAKKFETEVSAVGAVQDNAAEEKEIAKMASQFKVSKAFVAMNNKKHVDGVEAEVFEIARKEAKDAGIELSGNIHIPEKFIQIGKRKALTVGTEGADVVFTEYGGKVIPYLNPEPVAEKLGVTFLQGLRGNVQWPRESGDLAFAFETETADVDETTPTFDNVSITPKRFGGYVDITMQMLNQSVFMIDPWIRQKLSLRYGITVDTQIFNGSGSGNQTTGLFNMSAVNILSLGSGSANNMTYQALLSMKRDTKVSNARVGRSGWVTNAYGEYALYNTPKQASGIEGNFILNPDRPGTLASDPFYTSEIIPADFSEGGNSDLVGIAYSSNWGGLIAGFWGGLDILFDPYTQRLGGKVRFVVNSFMDVDVEQPLEFAICKDWDATDLPALT